MFPVSVYDIEKDDLLTGAEAEIYLTNVQRIRAENPYIALRQDMSFLLAKYSSELAIRALETTLLEYKAEIS